MVALKVFSAVDVKVATLGYERVDVKDVYAVGARAVQMVRKWAVKTVFSQAESSGDTMVAVKVSSAVDVKVATLDYKTVDQKDIYAVGARAVQMVYEMAAMTGFLQVELSGDKMVEQLVCIQWEYEMAALTANLTAEKFGLL